MSALLSPTQATVESWGRLPHPPPSEIIPLRWRHELPRLDGMKAPVLAYGQGRSYGDVCLNAGGTLLTTGGLNRILAFDVETGLFRGEAGVTLADILAVSVPRGWFLPVTPGTRYVSLGGAVANDVHGKNHHVAGTFGCFVTAMELVRSSGERLVLTPEGSTAPLFRATVSGLGLTGLITWVEIQLKPITSDRIDTVTTRFFSLDEFFEQSDAANAQWPYVVAWVDALRPEGRGLLMVGDHVSTSSDNPTDLRFPASDIDVKPKAAIPFNMPSWALSPISVRLFNTLYYSKQWRKELRKQMPYNPFFYPLDAVGNWNRGYGKRGFFQYQCVVPRQHGSSAIREILQCIAKSKAGSFLAVLKLFGDVPSPGMLSFPRPGVTLALDFPNGGVETVRLLHNLDAITAEAGGRVYPAKDACMMPASFRRFYPEWEDLVQYLDPAFSSSFVRRVTATE